MTEALETYNGRRVLVTGHTGFKGGWLALWLAHLGADVAGYALEPPTDPSLFEAIRLGRRVRHHLGDILDLQRFTEVIESERPEIVFHLAAQPLVLESYQDPLYTFQTNVIGTLNLLEIVRKTADIRAVVAVTSDKCYRNDGSGASFTESDPMGGNDPYSASKGCAELAVASMRHSYFSGERPGGRPVEIASVRAGNVIGGGDWGKHRIVPDIVSALSRGQEPEIRHPSSVRPWQFVLDPLYGYMLLGARLLAGESAFSGPWNFGPVDGKYWNVSELASEACRLWGADQALQSARALYHEDKFLRLDSSKARRELGWEPRFSLAGGLEQTIRWYTAFYHGVSAGELEALCLEQIGQYDPHNISRG